MWEFSEVYMKKTKTISILIFTSLSLICAGLSGYLWSLIPRSSIERWEDINVLDLVVISGLFLLFLVLVYRIQMRLFPLKPGVVIYNSMERVNAEIHMLFSIMYFVPIMRSFLLPLPFLKLFYQLLGAKLGANTYPSGTLYDPSLINIGSNTILGDNCLFSPHVLETEKLSYAPISVGNNVMIGMRSIILSGAIIEDNAIVAAGALVKKGTHIKAGEVWAGVPAKKVDQIRI